MCRKQLPESRRLAQYHQFQPFFDQNYWDHLGDWGGQEPWIATVTKNNLCKDDGICTRIACDDVKDPEWKVKGKGRRGIHNVTKNKGKGKGGEPGFEWVEMKAIMDSGAAETICGTQHVVKDSVKSTKASRSGMTYYAADGGEIPKLGESKIAGESSEGIPVSLTAQVSNKVSRILIAIRRACEQGNMVVFGADRDALQNLANCDVIEPNVIMNKKTKVTSKIQDEGGLYTYSIWQKRKIPEENVGMVSQDSQDQDDAWSPF